LRLGSKDWTCKSLQFKSFIVVTIILVDAYDNVLWLLYDQTRKDYLTLSPYFKGFLDSKKYA